MKKHEISLYNRKVSCFLFEISLENDLAVYNTKTAVSYTHLTLPTICSV